MIDIVGFFERQIEKWNDEDKCNLCWKFYAPLTESAANKIKLERGSECCVHVILLRDKVTAFSSTTNYNTTTTLPISSFCTKSFELIFAIPSNVDLNNWNEIAGHSTLESRWATIWEKIESCIACDLHLDFCELLGANYQVTQWQGRQIDNYLTQNFTGFRVTVTLRQNVYKPRTIPPRD